MLIETGSDGGVARMSADMRGLVWHRLPDIAALIRATLAYFPATPRIIACSISSQMAWAAVRWICCTTGVSSLGETNK
jgi:hypothetical protein